MGKVKVAQKTEDVSKEKAVSETKPGKASVKKVDTGRVYIKASYNNTLISVTDDKGNLLAWASAGTIGFSGPKKATPFAASKVASTLAE
ncbi:MAG: 30S ribosomal protein S11, partial [Candidatus Pacebacteria bacterium]|nr:30S ribosomal protein S11 [Candidatus Paceibacterota bacterium]